MFKFMLKLSLAESWFIINMVSYLIPLIFNKLKNSKNTSFPLLLR